MGCARASAGCRAARPARSACPGGMGLPCSRPSPHFQLPPGCPSLSASLSPPQGRGGPHCARVTCSGRHRPRSCPERRDPATKPGSSGLTRFDRTRLHPLAGRPARVPRGGAPVDRPGQSQASAPAEEPMNDELLRAGGCGPERSPRLRPLLLSLPTLAFPLKPVALQRLHPLSVLSLSN